MIGGYPSLRLMGYRRSCGTGREGAKADGVFRAEIAPINRSRSRSKVEEDRGSKSNPFAHAITRQPQGFGEAPKGAGPLREAGRTRARPLFPARIPPHRPCATVAGGRKRPDSQVPAGGCHPASAQSSPLTAELETRKQMASAISSGRIRRPSWTSGRTYFSR